MTIQIATLTLIFITLIWQAHLDISVHEYRLLIKKGERRLDLYRMEDKGLRLIKTYRIALGNQPVGTKWQQGDGATPEGDYYITHKNPRSKFYLSLGLSYPNITDADAGVKRGLITKGEHQMIVRAINRGEKPPQGTRLGGDIFIHGGGTKSDWTIGCIALDDRDIEELFEQLPLKTPVKIEP